MTDNAKIIDSEYNIIHNDTDTDTDTDTSESYNENTNNPTNPNASIAPYSILPTDEDRETIINDAIDELADIARENILEFKREDFNTEEVVGTWIDSYLCNYFAEITPVRSEFSTATSAEADALNEVLDVYIQELYNDISERFYEVVAPFRSSVSVSVPVPVPVPVPTYIHNIDAMTQKIQTLRNKPQPDQRTPEWYARRNNLITASAASKAFGSQASVNQLIYEKCKNYGGGGGGGPCEIGSPPITTPLQGPVNSPLHWGQRYEPLTVMIYEHRNHTKLGEFGCIQHDTYPFIGASPDGINIDPASPIYGRMVEIKNIFNREITGSPKEEYWIQTQIQMEVCDLDECDFVETRFKEFDSEEEYNRACADTGVNEKGRILWFQSAPTLTNQGYVSQPIQLYEYAPIGTTEQEYAKWEAAVFAKHELARNIWVRTIYWYLDEYSCVLVRRNRLWFSEAVKVLERVWAIIEEERETGYEHRAPAKKKTTTTPPSVINTTDNNGGGESEFKIIKLESAIVPTASSVATTTSINSSASTAAEATATNMATLMAINNSMFLTNKKYGSGRGRGGGGGGCGTGGHALKGPSEVLINCFKIDDLEIDESKV
jgi:putative phage-type endonuclease